MTLQQYTVTLTDLGTYQVHVVAADERTARAIAIDTLHEAVEPTPGLNITGRMTDAAAVVDTPQPSRRFKVTVTESHLLEALIPADDRATAVLQARRILSGCGPLNDFDLVDCRQSDEITAVEVVSCR